MGGSIRAKISSGIAQINIKNNFFEKGSAVWGGFLDFELFYSVVAENNVFLSGLVDSLVDNLGIASTLVLSGNTNISLSEYFGINNKYLNGISRSNSILFIFIMNFLYLDLLRCIRDVWRILF